MVTFALTLLVLLSPSDELMAASIAGAIRATLGAESTLELRVVAAPPDDATSVALARESEAAAVALITWNDVSHRSALLRVYDRKTGHWSARELAFTADDLAEEKGRTIGFNLASMVPEIDVAIAKNEPATHATQADRDPPATRSPVQTADVAGKPQETVASAQPTREPSVPPPWTFAGDATAQGVVAISGEGTSAGGALGAQYRLNDHFSLCAGAALRLGHIEALEARMVAIDFGPGLAWRSGDLDPGRRWALQLRLDAFARLESVRRDAERSRMAESHGRFVPGIGVGVELTFALSRAVAVLANTSAHAVLGRTDVLLRGSQVAAFAPIELGIALGARTYF
jgi:hypothetical protein